MPFRHYFLHIDLFHSSHWYYFCTSWFHFCNWSNPELNFCDHCRCHFPHLREMRVEWWLEKYIVWFQHRLWTGNPHRTVLIFLYSHRPFWTQNQCINKCFICIVMCSCVSTFWCICFRVTDTFFLMYFSEHSKHLTRDYSSESGYMIILNSFEMSCCMKIG